jgi:hypothetical protein
MLATRLKFIEDVVELFNKAFNFPYNTDVECLIFGSLNAMYEAELLKTVVSRLFVNCNIIEFKVSIRCKTMGDWHLHQT